MACDQPNLLESIFWQSSLGSLILKLQSLVFHQWLFGLDFQSCPLSSMTDQFYWKLAMPLAQSLELIPTQPPVQEAVMPDCAYKLIL